jgi:hypothetical protein
MDRSALCVMMNDISKHNHDTNLIKMIIDQFSLNHYHFIPGLLHPSPHMLPLPVSNLCAREEHLDRNKITVDDEIALHWVLHCHFKQVADNPITYINTLLLFEAYLKVGSAVYIERQ